VKAGTKMAFEVAAIRPDPAGERTTAPGFLLSIDDSFIHSGGLFHADSLLLVYIEFAYKYHPTGEQREALLAHLPGWVSSEALVIDARAEGNPTAGQLRLMMQSLLAERFHLAMHFEERMVPAFALMLDKPGAMGPKLRPHSGASCFEDEGSQSTGKSDQDASPPSCRHLSLKWTDHGQQKLDVRDLSIAIIAKNLGVVGFLGKPMIDETGLKGTYDFTLEWAPEMESDPQAVLGGPGFLEALKQQLGLKVKATRGPVRLPVVDHVERPTAN